MTVFGRRALASAAWLAWLGGALSGARSQRRGLMRMDAAKTSEVSWGASRPPRGSFGLPPLTRRA